MFYWVILTAQKYSSLFQQPLYYQFVTSVVKYSSLTNNYSKQDKIWMKLAYN